MSREIFVSLKPVKFEIMALGCLASLFGIKEKPAVPAEPGGPSAKKPASEESSLGGQVPGFLPVTTKRYFFSQDENAFFRALEESLAGSPYRVFPNVRLEDIFTIAKGEDYNSVRGRLKGKHADYLLVDAAKNFQPVLAIELDGKSHQRERQQYNDAVKDVVFRSAGLQLLRLPSQKYSAEQIHQVLTAFLALS